MSVRWKPLPDGFKVPCAEDPNFHGGGTSEVSPGNGKKKCPICCYRIRGRENNHEKGYHHNNPKKKKQ
jgi:hypothetical protein